MTAARVLFTVAVLVVFVAAIVYTAICAREAVEAESILDAQAAVTPLVSAPDSGAGVPQIGRAA